MCGENACGIHKGIGSLGLVVLLENFGSDALQVAKPLSLQGPLQFAVEGSGELLDVDLRVHKIVASFAELGIGDRFGEAKFTELVRMGDEWCELSRWVPTDTWKSVVTNPNHQFLRSDEDSEHHIAKPSGDRYTDRPLLSAEHKVACWLHDRGFLRCRHWPDALEAHAELKAANQLAIEWGWLDANGTHPNHPGPNDCELIHATPTVYPVESGDLPTDGNHASCERTVNRKFDHGTPSQPELDLGELDAEYIHPKHELPIKVEQIQTKDHPRQEVHPQVAAKRTINWKNLGDPTQDNIALRKEWLKWSKVNPGKPIVAYLTHEGYQPSTFAKLKKQIRAADAYLSRNTAIPGE